MFISSTLIFVFFGMLQYSYSQTIRDTRRPFYNIAHMVNSIDQVTKYLDWGANAIESDIQFNPDGSVKEVYHGFPCDCFRHCFHSVNLKDYLLYVRNITDPRARKSYYNRMVLQVFDLKLSGSNNKKESGRDLARHVLAYLWSWDNRRKHQVRVLVSIESPSDRDGVIGFIQQFHDWDVAGRLKDVGFDCANGDLWSITHMFIFRGVDNVWQGDGKTNCISKWYSDSRLRYAVHLRQLRYSYMVKVYHWTIDSKSRMRKSLDIGVDGMITNDPDDLLEVLSESGYRGAYRIATPDDDPFVKF